MIRFTTPAWFVPILHETGKISKAELDLVSTPRDVRKASAMFDSVEFNDFKFRVFPANGIKAGPA
jgi:cobalamin biosynthesis protein CbiG